MAFFDWLFGKTRKDAPTTPPAPRTQPTDNRTIEPGMPIRFQRFDQPTTQPTDNRTIEQLLNDLKQTDWTVVEKAALLLGERKDGRAVLPLIDLLEGTSELVKRFAADRQLLAMSKVMIQMDPISGTDSYLDVVVEGTASVRAAAAKALGSLGDIRAVEPLIAALKQSDRFVVDQVYLLVFKKDAQGAPLDDLRKMRSSLARPHAAHALGQLGDRRAIEALEAALADHEDEVRRAASGALNVLKNLPA